MSAAFFALLIVLIFLHDLGPRHAVIGRTVLMVVLVVAMAAIEIVEKGWP